MDYEFSECSPDDAEDIRMFTHAVVKKITDLRVKRLVCEFVFLVWDMVDIIDKTKKLDSENSTAAVTIASLVQIYRFLKKNEVAVKGIMAITEEGEPFLYD